MKTVRATATSADKDSATLKAHGAAWIGEIQHPYGFTGVPKKAARTLWFADHQLALPAAGKSPIALAAGEAVIYSDSASIHLKQDGSIVINGSVTVNGNITATGSITDGDGYTVAHIHDDPASGATGNPKPIPAEGSA